MTEIKAKIVEFDLVPHENADLLSIALIRGSGWQCVVKTSDMLDKSLGLYIPIDAEVPVSNSMFSFLDKGAGKPFRIKTIRLRGSLSQGLLLPAPEGAKLGDDLTEALGVTRWEPAIPTCLAGDMVREPGNFQKYTSIENYKNYPHIFQDGDLVRITEKIHGTNCRYGFVNDGSVSGLKYFVGTHKTARDKDGTNLYSKIGRELQIEEKLTGMMNKNIMHHFIIYGEIYGSSVQDLNYGCAKNEQQFRIFDVCVDHQYQSWSVVQEVAVRLGVETVPLLHIGPFSLEKALALRDGRTTLGGGHVREGIVVTAEPETSHSEIGRKIIKFISDDYLLRKNATDGH